MKYLIACGGTSGHVNPAIAIAQELRNRDSSNQILFVGTKGHVEADLVPRAGFDMEYIDVTGIIRRFTKYAIKHNIGTAFKYVKAQAQISKLIKKFKPDVVIGTGGYVTAPVIKTACRKRIKTVIHEQNAFAGLVTKMVADKVDLVLLSYELAKPIKVAPEKIKLVGNPARDDFFNVNRKQSREILGIAEDEKLVLSYGGSLGAKRINEAFCEMAREASKEDLVTFRHGASRDYDHVCEELSDILSEKIKVYKYIYDMPTVMSAADLIVSRSGATTLTELAAVGKASILIPSPTVTENHQYYNAKTFADKGAAVLIEQKDLNGKLLYDTIKDIVFDSEKLKNMEKAAHSFCNRNCVETICDCIESV